ncbi:HAMP domain-containing histidine kinase [Lacrimispora sp. NSJ-141]|uniref:histidine kinase n=1 Tax=Lientehia hominis TaxID=2897778 RepID=A0AAP2RJ23_9FIRM|nr:HAMP domain-containing sensor histidine kinase [Lientehia hominis]MCD2492877.1 HAMP domain-containing histidine kinase [Lientehia hominis]
MKLYQRIMAATFVILTLSGVICGGILGVKFRDRQISRAVETEMSNYDAARYTFQRLYMAESRPGDSKQISYVILKYIFRQNLFEDYIFIDEEGTICDSSEYMITYDPAWKKENKYEDTEYSMEELEGEHLMVLGSREAWAGENCYLFSVRSLTVIYNDTETFLWQFSGIWFLMVGLASVFTAAAAKMVLKPLEELERAAVAVSEGSYDWILDVKRKDETGHVAAAFNNMAKQVEMHVSELEHASEQQKQLLGSLTHEIRTPMTSIIGYSETLLQMRLKEEEKQKALHNIHEQACYLQRLSSKMMELSGLYQNSAISMRSCVLKEILQNAVLMEEKRWPDKKFILEIEEPAESAAVQGDEDLLLSLFVNLTDNAAKASLKGQEIRIRLTDGNNVSVQDFGKGIPSGEMKKIKVPFYMTDKARGNKQGLGLGLAICEQIAKLHGIKMDIESEEGEGTTITLLFPKEPEI